MDKSLQQRLIELEHELIGAIALLHISFESFAKATKELSEISQLLNMPDEKVKH